MLMSIVMTSGFRDSAIVMASRPSLAWPTTVNCPSALKMVSRTLRMKAESSTISTRNFFAALVTIALLRHWYDWARCLRSHKLFDCGDQLILLHGLSQKGRGPFF